MVVEEVGEEHVVDVVNFMWRVFILSQVLREGEGARLAFHQQINFHLIDQGNEVDESVLDLAAGLRRYILILLKQFLLFIVP